MDFPKAPTPPSNPAWRILALGTAALALGYYAYVLTRHVGAVAGASDSSGYMNHARLLAAGHVHVQPRIVPGLPQGSAPPNLYVPLGFKPAWNGDGLVPTYPTGLGLLVLLLEPVAGWGHAGDAVMILHSLAGLIATYALGRAFGLGRLLAGLGAAIVALSPLYLFMSLQAMSDIPSLFWTTAAVLAALRSRERPYWALAAGAAIAIDVLLRPTNVLAFIPVAIALGTSPRRLALFVAGGLPGAVFLLAHNHASYGSFITTGYEGNTNIFQAGYVPGSLLQYAHWLPRLFTPVVVLCLGLPFLPGVGVRSRWILGSWVFAYAAFYSAYEYTQEVWWYERFLLPAAPALVVGGLLVLRAVTSRLPAWLDPGRSAAVVVVILALVAGYSKRLVSDLYVFTIGDEELRYERACDWLRANLPPDAVCLTMQASGALFYYTHFTFIRWDMLDEGNVGKVETAIRSARRPLYAVLFPFEVERSGALDRKMPGHWTEVGKVEDVRIYRRDFGTAQN